MASDPLTPMPAHRTPAAPSRHEVQIHVPGILKILGEALYTKPEVALRELLQNAHDSIVRRRLQSPAGTHVPPGRIVVTPDARRGFLALADNGSGLTLAEIHEFLATVGKGYTALLRDELSFSDPESAAELIGQFGLGLLSAFLIADEVIVDTRSALTDEAFLWRSRGDGTYTVEPGNRDEAGTTVRLKIKSTCNETGAGTGILDAAHLRDVLKTYADFLPVPIQLADDPQPVNALHAPWHRRDGDGDGGDSSEEAYRAFLKHRFPQLDPLAIIPLADVQVTQQREPVTIPLGGVLCIPADSSLSTGEYGDVCVYVRRMLVEENCQDLLPPWARFVTGVVDSPALSPTASRESVRRDAIFHSLREAIGSRILDHLETLALTDPERFRTIVGAHNELIKAWALNCPAIFPQVVELVVFATGHGPLTLKEIHARVQQAYEAGRLKIGWKARPLYYTEDRAGSAQARLLLESRGVPVIDAAHGWELLFLERYAELQHDVDLVRVQAGEQSVFLDPPRPAAHYRALLEACELQGIRAVAAQFEPKQLPALLVLDEDEHQVMTARRLAERVDIIGQLREVVEDIAGSLDDEFTRRGVLYLNAAHPLIERLTERDADDEGLNVTVSLLYAHAALLEQRSMTRESALRLFTESADAMRHFLQARRK